MGPRPALLVDFGVGAAELIKTMALAAVLVCVNVFGTRADGQRANELFSANRASIVKVVASGIGPDGVSKRLLGSGFVATFNQGQLFIVTAKHVVGSDVSDSSKNEDWSVENGAVQRKIEIFGLDEGNIFRKIGTAEEVAINRPENIDLALLVITNGPELPSLKLRHAAPPNELNRDVMLMAFKSNKGFLTQPIPLAEGARAQYYQYVLSSPSTTGESGGPWIDLKSGGVIAVAHGIEASQTAPSTLAVPVDFVMQILKSVGQSANLRYVDDEPKSLGRPVKFAILDISGSVFGSWEECRFPRSSSKLLGLNTPLVLSAVGTEQSQCDPNSGRKASEAEVRGEVTPTIENGLMFDYRLAAQGGHYRTAVPGCLGNNLIGLHGNDTTSSAAIEFMGKVTFEANRNMPLAIAWERMPEQGALYEILNEDGKLVERGKLVGTGNKQFELPASGKYSLNTSIERTVFHKGIAGFRWKPAVQ